MPGEFDIPYMAVSTTQDEIDAVARVLRSNRHCDGPELRRFQRALAEYLDVPETVAVNSGSTANLLALKQICRESPTVKHAIIPACSFATTFNAVLEMGLRPVVIDVEPDTLLPTLDSVRTAVDLYPNSLLVITHIMGVAWPWVADSWDVPVLEDCCDALGALVDDRKVGTFGTFGTFSFYPAHHLNCAGGGSISVPNPPADVELRHAREWGRLYVQGAPVPTELHEFEARYTYVRRGGNFQMNELQAALGLAQMRKLEGFIRRRDENHEFIAKRFEEEGLLSQMTLVRPLPGTTPSWFGFPAVSKEGVRPRLIRDLGDKGIQCRPIIGGNVLRQPTFRDIRCERMDNLAGCDILHDRGFFVASHPYLTEDEMEYRVRSFQEFFGS